MTVTRIWMLFIWRSRSYAIDEVIAEDGELAFVAEDHDDALRVDRPESMRDWIARQG